MRVIVCGSRKWKDGIPIKERLDLLPEGAILVHGACPSGADSWVDWWYGPPSNVRPIERHPALWKKHGSPRAAHIRNQAMADAGADLCIAFADKMSGGTWDMVTRARKAGIPVEVIWAKNSPLKA